jgi:hypothetical protein
MQRVVDEFSTVAESHNKQRRRDRVTLARYAFTATLLLKQQSALEERII